MSAILRKVAAEIYGSYPVQQQVQGGLYKVEHLLAQAIKAARAFAEVAEELELRESGTRVAIGGFAARVATVLCNGNDAVFIAHAEIACRGGASFDKLFDEQFPSKATADAEMARIDSEIIGLMNRKDAGSDAGSGSGTGGDGAAHAAGEQAPQAEKAVEPPTDVPLEELGLPDKVVELLQGANFTTAKQILEADKKGGIEAIQDIGPKIRKKIVDAATASLAPKASN